MAIEFTSNDWLSTLYLAYWGRAADPNGLNYWVGQWGEEDAEGNTKDGAWFASNFALQEEAEDEFAFFAAYNAGEEITDQMREDFVDAIYQNLFSRQPDAKGKDYWLGLLSSGDADPGKFIGDIVYAALEDETGNDAQTLLAKKTVADFITEQADASDWSEAEILSYVQGEEAGSIIANTTPDNVADQQAVADNDIPDPVIPGETFTLTASADSFDEGETATFDITGAEANTEYAYKVTGDGAAAQVAAITTDADGKATFTVDVSDALITDATVTVSIIGEDATSTVTAVAVNDAPALTGSAETLPDGVEDTAYTVDGAVLLAGYTDEEGDAISVANLTTDNDATVTDNGDGTYTITPAENFNGEVTLSYEVTDGTDATAATQTLAFAAVNDAPTATAATNTATEAGDVVEGQLEAADVDEDALTYALDAPVDGLTLNDDGSYAFDPTANPAVQALTYTDDSWNVVANYTVDDGNGGTAQSNLTITVEPTPLTFTLEQSTATVAEGSTVEYTLVASEPVQEDFTGTIQIALEDGDTASLDDFGSGSFNPQTVTIANGETTSTVATITPTNDAVTEMPETFTATATIDGYEVESVATTVQDPSSVGGLGQTFTLTTGVDEIPGLVGSANSTGTDGDDTIKADYDVSVGAHTLSGLDDLDGGLGSDVLKITDAKGDTVDVSLPQSVKNIETVTVASVNTLSGNTADISGWTDVTDATFTLKSATVQAVTVADTTDVTVTNSLGGVTVTDGASQTVTSTGASTTTLAGSEGAVTATVSKVGTDGGAATPKVVIDGGTDVTLTATGMTDDATAGAGNEDIVIGSTTAPTGAVSVSASGKLTDAAGAGADDVTMGDIAVTGGSSVDVTVSAGITSAQETAALTAATNDTVTQSGVIVTGSADTTEVTVTQDAAQGLSQYAAGPPVVDGKIGIVNGAVTIADANAASTTKAGTITTVTLDSFGVATVNSSALTTLNLMGTGTSVAVTQGALTTPTVTEQTVNAEDLTLTGALTLDNDIKTANIDVTGEVDLQGTQAIAGATTINVTGTGNLDSAGETFTALTALNITNTGSTTLSTQLGNGVTVTAAGGAEDLAFGATTKANTLGAGNDTARMGAALGTGGSVDAGDGTDTLAMFSADAAARSANATFEAGISNFEILSLGATGAGAGDAVNVANLDDISTVISAGVTAGGLTLSGLQAINDVTFTGLIAAGSSLALATDTGNADIVNVNLVAADGFTSTADLTINGVETINVMTDDNAGAAATTRFTQGLAADEVTNLNVSGDTGLIIGNMAGTTLTTFDASGMTGTGEIGGVDFAATGALAAESTFTGGAGNDDLSAAAAVAVVNMDGGEGNDVLTGGTKADVLVGGEGTDIMTGGAGPDSLTGGAGADVFAFNTASATDSNGVNQDTIEDFVSGTDKISTGSYVSYQGEANGYGAVLTSLSNSSGNIEGVLDTQTNTLYIDVNDDGDLTVADLTINLGTVSDLSQSDFVTHVGTFGDDVINGTANKDVILAFDGADQVTPGADADDVNLGDDEDADVLIVAAGDTVTSTAQADNGAAGLDDGDTLTFGNGVDIVTNFVDGDDSIDSVLGSAALSDGSAAFDVDVADYGIADNNFAAVRGDYDANTGVFTTDAAGADMFVAFDQDATTTVAIDEIILIGSGADTITAADFAA